MISSLVEGYIALRRRTGFKFTDASYILRGFARFADAKGDKFIRTKTVIAWSRETSGKHMPFRRVDAVRRLAKFLHAEDRRHEVPPHGIVKPEARRPAPYIFTQRQIELIIAHAHNIGQPGTFLPLMYSTMYALIAVTGMRSQEVRFLRLKDFDGVGLTVRETKFRKSRYLPLHTSTVAALKKYIAVRLRIPSKTDHLFVSWYRKQFGHTRLQDAFRRICAQAGIKDPRPGQHPSVHDLRHTFAVRALERCPRDRAGVERHMIALATYLGHADMRSTYWYLERTPRLLKDIARACDAALTRGRTG